MKTLLTSVLILSCIISSAQPNRFSLALDAGISVASLTYDDTNLDDIYDSRLGYAAGTTFHYNFSKLFSLLTGIMYERKGASSDITFADNTGTIIGKTKLRDNFDYLVVPLLLRVTTANKVNFNINAGPYLGILLKRQWKYKDKVISPNGTPLTEPDLTDETEKSEIGIAGGIGITTRLSEKVDLSLQLRDYKGLTNDLPFDNVSLTTNSLLFLAGVVFKLDSKEDNTKEK